MVKMAELPNITIQFNQVTFSDHSFIRHFSIAYAFEPFNLVKEITYRADHPGSNHVIAHFPSGLNVFLKDKHPEGIIEIPKPLFAQFNHIILTHLKTHPSLDTLKSMRFHIINDTLD